MQNFSCTEKMFPFNQQRHRDGQPADTGMKHLQTHTLQGEIAHSKKQATPDQVFVSLLENNKGIPPSL